MKGNSKRGDCVYCIGYVNKLDILRLTIDFDSRNSRKKTILSVSACV